MVPERFFVNEEEAMSEIPTYLRKPVLSTIYPYNVAIEVLGSEADVYRIHIPTLCRHIAGLGNLQRQVIEGIYFYGRTALEVAEDMLGCSGEDVDTIHDRAIRELKTKCTSQPILMIPADEIKNKPYGNVFRKVPPILSDDEGREIYLDLLIGELGLPARAERILSDYGVTTLRDLAKLTRDDLEKMHGFGSVCLYKTMEIMKEYGCYLKGEK